MLRQLDADMRAIVLIQQGQLFQQIVAEQFRIRNGGGIATGMGETSPGARFEGFMIGAVPGDRQLRIDKKAFRAGFGIGERIMVDIVADGFA
ncbi:Uncharacterised protein [Klebsiella pneumoniae]|jgi:hypothetical protein|nr:Uncharacterised protein [Klebsiella pneumoniae]SAU90571.1 Uncharacterised protein [Klebsiella pneumoniae]SAW93905.1 Uncharacterised protein [Klebsiella pneumoniae]